MQLLLKEEACRCNLDTLHRRGYQSCLFVQLGNRKGYIVSKQNIDILELLRSNGFVVSLSEKTKVPIYKQAMAYQMGKTPKVYKESLHTYRVVLLENNLSNYAYTVWSI